MTSCAKSFEAPVDEGFIRGRREGRVREVDGVKGIGAVRADLVAGCGGWQSETDLGDGLASPVLLLLVAAPIVRNDVPHEKHILAKTLL